MTHYTTSHTCIEQICVKFKCSNYVTYICTRKTHMRYYITLYYTLLGVNIIR